MRPLVAAAGRNTTNENAGPVFRRGIVRTGSDGGLYHDSGSGVMNSDGSIRPTDRPLGLIGRRGVGRLAGWNHFESTSTSIIVNALA